MSVCRETSSDGMVRDKFGHKKTSQVGFLGKQTLSWKLAGCLLGSELHTWAKRSPQNLSCPQGGPSTWFYWVQGVACPSMLRPEWEMLGQGHNLKIKVCPGRTPCDASPYLAQWRSALPVDLSGPPQQRDLATFRSPLMILENHLIFYSYCHKKKNQGFSGGSMIKSLICLQMQETRVQSLV